MKNILTKLVVLSILVLPSIVLGANYISERSGYILLQVEKNGEAWYVYPTNGRRYYLGRPDDAFAIMKQLALGATHDYIANTTVFPERLSGLILLDVEKNGEAYYIYPRDNKKYYLGRPADAFRIMSNLGQGISNAGLSGISIGNIINAPTPVPSTSSGKVLQNVPFTSQAPYGKWSDLRQEDGCEEASALMAVKWARGEALTSEVALQEILGSSDYTLDKYNEYRDITTKDTLNWIIKDYFNYQNAALKINVSFEEIIDELTKGNVLIIPVNGQIIGNPYYVAPGPINHMMVISGYDPLKKVFITNDPGTRHGALYEYDAQLLYKAIRDYPTGFHEINTGSNKDVIVVWK